MFFSEEYYLQEHPDVAAIVRQGVVASGFVHYLAYGRAEGRRVRLMFDEALYSRRYYDVARSIRRGDVASGLDHYLKYGWREGRSLGQPLPADTELMAPCCSLGENCEFGLMQAAFDAHPLDLTRWASLPTPLLLNLLMFRFADLGNPRSLAASVGSDGEWDIADTRYDLKWHSYIDAGAVEAATVLSHEAKRIAWLARKMLADLERGTRLFVRSRHQDEPGDGERILEMLRRFNPHNRLLWVHLANDGHLPGSVEQPRPGLTIGYIESFWSFSPPSADARPSLSAAERTWKKLCQLATIGSTERRSA